MPTMTKSKTKLSVTVPKDAFLSRLKAIVGLIPSKPVAKSAGCVLLVVNAGQTPGVSMMAATSHESAEWTIKPEGESVRPGRTAINGRRFLEVVTAIRSKSLEIEVDGDHLTVSGGFASYTLDCEDADLFPTATWSEKPVTHRGHVGAGLLRRGLERTAWCCGFVKDKPAFGGVWFYFRDCHLILGGSDSMRLSMYECGRLEGAASDIPTLDRITILPKEVVQQLVDLLPDDAERVQVHADLGTLEVRHDGKAGSLRARFTLINNKYPDFPSIIPDRDVDRAIKVSGSRLGSLVKLMEGFRPDDRLGLDLKFTPIGGSDAGLCIADAVSTHGQAHHEIDCTVAAAARFDRTQWKLRINPADFTQLCSFMGNDCLTLYMPTSEGDPFRVEAFAGWTLLLTQVVDLPTPVQQSEKAA